MLVLTRKLSQQIKIGDNVTLTVLRVKGNTVRLGIEAPRDVRVVRSELPAEGSENSNETVESILGEVTVELQSPSNESSDSTEAEEVSSHPGVSQNSLAPRLPVRKGMRSNTPPLRHLCTASHGMLAK